MINSENYLAPVALFCYKRVDKLQQTVESLKQNILANETVLYIFSDGSKGGDDLIEVLNVRSYIRGICGFREVKIVESDANRGLANSIISGVSDILSVNESLIVLEDDMILSPHFLQYMNDALKVYASNNSVCSISGYTPCSFSFLNKQTYSLMQADCWGWGTWRDAWSIFNPNSKVLLNEIKKRGLEEEFDRLYPSDFLFSMLELQARGELDSWAIRWIASTFLAKKYTIYPTVNLVENIGLDGSGTHEDDFDISVQLASFRLEVSEIYIEENEKVLVGLKKYYSQLYGERSWLRKFVKRMLRYAGFSQISARL